MNYRQKVILILSLVVILAMLLFPPWFVKVVPVAWYFQYSFILAPPDFPIVYPGGGKPFRQDRPVWELVVLQVLVVVCVARAWYRAMGRQPNRSR